MTEWPVQELSKAHLETIDLELGLYRSQQSLKSLSAEERARLSEAQRLERTVNPSSVLLAEGIEPILQSGAFEVSGTISFNPLRPFDPNPKIPETDAQGNLVGDAQNRFYATEPIGGEQGYQYSQGRESGSRRGGEPR
jgi:hypothetical protein